MLNQNDSSYVAVQAVNEMGFIREHLIESIQIIRNELIRPSVIYKPKLSLDGNQYCFMLGENPMEGCVGYGSTVEEAARDFDKNWHEYKLL